MEGSHVWRQGLIERPQRDPAYQLAPHGLLTLLSYSTKGHLPGMVLPTSYAIPYQSSIKKITPKTCQQANLKEVFFSVKVPSFQMILVCVKSTVNLNIHILLHNRKLEHSYGRTLRKFHSWTHTIGHRQNAGILKETTITMYCCSSFICSFIHFLLFVIQGEMKLLYKIHASIIWEENKPGKQSQIQYFISMWCLEQANS